MIEASLNLAAGFKPFSLMHLLVLAGYVPVIVLLCVLGARWRHTQRGRHLHHFWLAFVAFVQFFNIVFWSTPPRLNPAESLPLHICDLAGIAAVFDLISHRRVWRTILYYWGIGLSTQAFITPVITDGPETIRFHLFFASHLTIIGTGCYDLVARGYRPGWKDMSTIIVITLAWIALILPLNISFGWNYGYIGRSRPSQPTLVDHLGSWPLRLLWMWLIVVALFAILTAVWKPWRRRTGPIPLMPAP